jgi:hypothetical protein
VQNTCVWDGIHWVSMGAKAGMDAVWGPRNGLQAAELPRVCLFSNRAPRLLVFGESQQWRAKTAENMGDRGWSFRLFLRAFASLLVTKREQQTPNRGANQ